VVYAGTGFFVGDTATGLFGEFFGTCETAM
jgi:hypothetical protein